MRRLTLPRWWPFIGAFTIWFAHFMLCWAAAEIWPHRWAANVLAWAVTGLALLALGAHWFSVNSQHADGRLLSWHWRVAQGAIAIATTAVLFSVLPSIVFLP